MRRLFCLLAVSAIILSGCSILSPHHRSYSRSPQFAATYPSVRGLKATIAPKNDSTDLDGSIYVDIPQSSITIASSECNHTVNSYIVAIKVTTVVKQTGHVAVSIGLRTNPQQRYIWYVSRSKDPVDTSKETRVAFFVVDVPANADVYLKVVAVGGDMLGDHSSRHYTESTPGGGDSPTITASQCLMHA